MAWAQTRFPTFHKSDHKMSTGNMDSFAEQCSENHFNILQTYVPANKEKEGAVWVKKEAYFKNEQPQTRKG